MPMTWIDWMYFGFLVISMFFIFLFLLLFLSEKGGKKKPVKLKKLPSISIIIPAYNKEKVIEGTIKAVKNIKYPAHLKEIIVVDDGSKDRTYEIIKKINGIKALTKPNGGRADALNYGIRHAKGEIVITVDADSYPKPDSVLKAIDFFSDKDVAGVTCTVLVNKPKKFIEKLQNFEYSMFYLTRKMLEAVNCIYVTPGPLALYRKDVIKKIGGFDTKNMTEDIEIAWRILKYGYKIKISIESEVLTDVPENWRQWWHQRIRWSVGGIQTTIKYFNLLFSRKVGNIGYFLLPTFIMGYFFVLFAFFMAIYALINALVSFFSTAPLALSYGMDIKYLFGLFEIPLPNIFVFSSLIMLFISLLWIRLSINALATRIKISENLHVLFFYLFLYIVPMPLNVLYAMWKFLRKTYTW